MQFTRSETQKESVMRNDRVHAARRGDKNEPSRRSVSRRNPLKIALYAVIFAAGLFAFEAVCASRCGLTSNEGLLLCFVYAGLWIVGLVLSRPAKGWGWGLVRVVAAGLGLVGLLGSVVEVCLLSEEETLPVGALYLAGCLILRLRARKRAGLKPAKQVESAALPGQATEAIPPAAPEAAQRSLAAPQQNEPLRNAAEAGHAENAPNAVPTGLKWREPNRRPRRAACRLACLVLPVGLLASGLVLYTCVRQPEPPVPIPESLQVFKQKYPEAASFVDDYPRARNAHPSMDVSGEVTKGVVPLFIQWDERWGYTDYGGGFFGTNGCGPTCLSMVVCGLTGDTSVTPYAVAQYCEEQGWYTPGAGTSWSLMSDGARHYGLSVENGTVSAEYLTEALAEGKVLIASMKPGDFTYTGHFIVLTGLDKDGKVLVNDSNSPLNSAKAWDAQTLAEQMKGVWAYRQGRLPLAAGRQGRQPVAAGRQGRLPLAAAE